MRKVEWSEGFCLTGTIPGAARPDVVKEITLPFRLQSVQEMCGQEGLFLRSWELHALLEKPEEPPHSHAERTLLTLDGVSGGGELIIGDAMHIPLAPHMELDVTEALRNGSAGLCISFPPQHPRLLCGEHGCDLIAQGGLHSMSVRNIYHLRFEDITISWDGEVRMHIHAYGAGKVRLRARLMLGEELLWTENSTVQLVVGTQVILRSIAASCLRRGAVLYVSADMGGEGCDSCEAVYSDARISPRYLAHFRALPTEQMLREIKKAGFDGAVFYECPHKKLLQACAEHGLYAQWQKSDISLTQILNRDAAYDAEKEGCLYVPMLSEADEHCFEQAQRLKTAVLTRRMEGKPVDVLALSRQRDAQDGLFDEKGQPRMSMYALRNALGKIAMCTGGKERVYHSYEEFCEEIILMCDAPDQKPAAVQVQLYAWNGREIAARVFPFCMKEKVHRLGHLRARLPMNELQGLVLRMQCIRDGKILAVDHAYYPCANEYGERIAYPEADLTECIKGELCNAGDTTAMGVCIACDEKILLSYSAMLPQERITIAYTDHIMVKYGNVIRKGGKERAELRILRGVFSDPDAAAYDPEAVHC